MDSQQYWITDGGEWGSNIPDTVEFVGHHANIHEAFDMVQDWQLQSWASWLSRNPHEATPVRPGIDETCQTCIDLADEFGIM